MDIDKTVKFIRFGEFEIFNPSYICNQHYKQKVVYEDGSIKLKPARTEDSSSQNEMDPTLPKKPGPKKKPMPI